MQQHPSQLHLLLLPCPQLARAGFITATTLDISYSSSSPPPAVVETGSLPGVAG
jgi:hypothetical protein